MAEEKYYRCKKNYIMDDLTPRHEKGIIYKMVDGNMPCQGRTYHQFEINDDFHAHFEEVHVVKKGFFDEVNKALNERDEQIAEMKRQLEECKAWEAAQVTKRKESEEHKFRLEDYIDKLENENQTLKDTLKILL